MKLIGNVIKYFFFNVLKRQYSACNTCSMCRKHHIISLFIMRYLLGSYYVIHIQDVMKSQSSHVKAFTTEVRVPYGDRHIITTQGQPHIKHPSGDTKEGNQIKQIVQKAFQRKKTLERSLKEVNGIILTEILTTPNTEAKEVKNTRK